MDGADAYPMSISGSYDVVVVGAGIEGSSAAYHCAKEGKRVLLLEQFSLPHKRGSSHGTSRIITLAQPTPHHQKMMEDAFPMWRQLEKETETELYRETGVLAVTGENSKGFAEQILGAMQKDGDCKKLTEEERARRFPHFTFSPGAAGYFYKKGGYIRAGKALKCYQDVFVKNGGVLRDGEKMLEIIPGAMVTVRTTRGEYQARSLILAPGPWAANVLMQLGLDLPLQPGKLHHLYWKETTPGMYRDFPVINVFNEFCFDYSGLTEEEKPGMVKFSKWLPTPILGPRQRGSMGSTREIELSRDYVREHFPGLDADNGPVITEPCVVTNTSDEEFILDVHPYHPNIAIGCGFSGYGFSFAPVVGEILGRLAFGDFKLRHDIRTMAIRRFLPVPSESLPCHDTLDRMEPIFGPKSI